MPAGSGEANLAATALLLGVRRTLAVGVRGSFLSGISAAVRLGGLLQSSVVLALSMKIRGCLVLGGCVCMVLCCLRMCCDWHLAFLFALEPCMFVRHVHGLASQSRIETANRFPSLFVPRLDRTRGHRRSGAVEAQSDERDETRKVPTPHSVSPSIQKWWRSFFAAAIPP